MGSFCGANSQSTTNATTFTNPSTANQQGSIYNEGQRIYAQNMANPQATVAGLNSGQQSMIDYLRGIPGGSAQWAVDAAGMTKAGQGYVQDAASQLGATSGYLQQGANAATAAQNPTTLQAWNPQAYMSPYTDSVVNSTLANFDRNADINNNSTIGNFIKSGNAFGGDRAGVALAEDRRNQSMARGQLESGLRQADFNQASQQAANQQQMDLARQQNDAARMLQSAGTFGSLAGANTSAGSSLGGLGSIQSAIGQGYGNIANQSATTQASTATQALDAATLAQKTQQAQLNAPWTQLGFLTANSPGTNQAPTTTTNTYPGQNPLGTILGGATALSQIPGLSNLFKTGGGTSGQDTNSGYSNNFGFVNAANNDPAFAAFGGRIEKAHGGSIADLYQSPEEIYKESMPTSSLSGMGGFAAPTTQIVNNQTAAPQAQSSGSSFGIGDAIKIGATLLPLLSDERAKENAEEIGRTHDDQPIYRYNYKGDPRTTIGLMAQDVEQHTPEAVTSIGGLKGVDYNVATKDAVRADGGRMGGSDDVFSRYHRVAGDMRRAQGGEIPRFEDGGRNPPDYFSKPDPNWQPGRSDTSFLGGALRNNSTLQAALGIMAGAGKRDQFGLPISPMAQIGQGLQYGTEQAKQRDEMEQKRYMQERQMWEEKARLAQRLAQEAQIAQGKINGQPTLAAQQLEESRRQHDKPQWGVVGHNALTGMSEYGWINPQQAPNFAPRTPGASVPGSSAVEPRSGTNYPAGIIPSTSNTSIPGDHTLSGDAFLASLDKPLADNVKALVEGRFSPPGGMSLKSPYIQGLFRLAAQYDPNFDMTTYQTRQAIQKDFGSGKSAQNITSFNTAIGHMDSLYKAIDGLDNSKYPLYNNIAQSARVHLGDDVYASKLKAFQTAKTAVTDELVRAFRGSGGNVHDIIQWEKNLNAADSPKALKEATKTGIELLRSRIEALGDTYNRGMKTNRDPMSLLSPKARHALERIETDGRESNAAPQNGVTQGHAVGPGVPKESTERLNGPKIDTMTVDQLKALDPKTLTQDELVKAKKRFDELSKQ